MATTPLLPGTGYYNPMRPGVNLSPDDVYGRPSSIRAAGAPVRPGMSMVPAGPLNGPPRAPNIIEGAEYSRVGHPGYAGTKPVAQKTLGSALKGWAMKAMPYAAAVQGAAGEFGTWQHRDAAGKPIGVFDESGSDMKTALADAGSSMAQTADSLPGIPALYDYNRAALGMLGVELPERPSLRGAFERGVTELTDGRMTPDNGGNLVTALFNPSYKAGAAAPQAVAQPQTRPEQMTSTPMPPSVRSALDEDNRFTDQTSMRGVDIRTGPQEGTVGTATASPGTEDRSRTLRAQGGRIDAKAGWETQNSRVYGAPEGAGVAKKNIEGTDVYAIQEKGKSPLFTNMGNYKDANTFGVSTVASDFSKDPEKRKQQIKMEMAEADVSLAESPYERRQAKARLREVEQNQLLAGANDAKQELATLRAAGKQMNPLEARKLELENAKLEQELQQNPQKTAHEMTAKSNDQALGAKKQFFDQMANTEYKDNPEGLGELSNWLDATNTAAQTGLTSALKDGKSNRVVSELFGWQEGAPLTDDQKTLLAASMEQNWKNPDGTQAQLYSPANSEYLSRLMKTVKHRQAMKNADGWGNYVWGALTPGSDKGGYIGGDTTFNAFDDTWYTTRAKSLARYGNRMNPFDSPPDDRFR